jgi:hypothetical protein
MNKDPAVAAIFLRTAITHAFRRGAERTDGRRGELSLNVCVFTSMDKMVASATSGFFRAAAADDDNESAASALGEPFPSPKGMVRIEADRALPPRDGNPCSRMD